jgi:hypothetical protein
MIITIPGSSESEPIWSCHHWLSLSILPSFKRRWMQPSLVYISVGVLCRYYTFSEAKLTKLTMDVNLVGVLHHESILFKKIGECVNHSNNLSSKLIRIVSMSLLARLHYVPMCRKERTNNHERRPFGCDRVGSFKLSLFVHRNLAPADKVCFLFCAGTSESTRWSFR